ncbi:MAG: hypothetical protein K8M05_33170 [Deltaproteobacteria bacterium]|nr:hypothetical protein [Kofleriaceae bacterium]
MALPARWTFTTEPRAARTPHVMLVAFSAGPLADNVPLSLSKFGGPSAELVGALDVRTIPRGADPSWFEGWRHGSLRTIAADDLGPAALAELDLADHVHVVQAAPERAADLGYLQAAWAVARHVVARGATVVLDVHAMIFHRGAALAPPGAALDVARELRIVFETDSTRDDGAHALHTRGLKKFGAPDLVALCSPNDARLVSDVIAQLADAVARGDDLALPRHGVDLEPGTTWYAIDDEHGLADILGLNNAARVLVDERGRHLVGVLARLQGDRDRPKA